MKKLMTTMLLLLLTGGSQLYAQAKHLVVVANKDIQYEDPRWGSEQTLEEGRAISVADDGEGYYSWWIYPAANVNLDKENLHIPGTKQGEKCIIINGTNVRFREKPSTKSGILCYNTDSGASYYSIEFVKQASTQRHMTVDGQPVYWDPYYLPKGTRLPYKGKEGDFYKTEFNGFTLYISAIYSYLK